ncbi:MAG: phage tail terminator-like protein [Wohlfahrtiimonas sp.]
MEIRTLCDVKLRDFAKAKGIPIAYENVSFKGSETYLEPFLLPASNNVATFGREQESGIYQVNIYLPISEGPKKADDLAKEIMDLFKTGSQSGDFIHLPPSSRSGGFKTETHYCVAISINYMRIK